MPRRARLDAPGTLHHVMIRGIERRQIVDDDEDRRTFVDRMGIVALETGTKVPAWSLLNNHAHILLKSGPKGLSQFMRRFLTGYAVRYNLRHGRHGHLFQNRFKSIVCDEDEYFQELVRYIHLNPLRAEAVKDLGELDRYSWCGHGGLVGRNRYPWQDRSYVLSWFGKGNKQAVNAYRRFMAEGISQGHRPELVGGGLIRSMGGWSEVIGRRRKGDFIRSDARILGVDDFVERILKEAEPKLQRSFPPLKSEKRLQNIIEEGCRKSRIHVAELQSGSRRREVALLRGEIARRLSGEYGLSLAETARHLGVSTSAICRILTRDLAKVKRGKNVP